MRSRTKFHGALDEPWISPGFKLSEFCKDWVLGDERDSRLSYDFSDFGLSLCTLSCVFKFCRKLLSKVRKYEGEYNVDKNIADSFCTWVKTDQMKHKPESKLHLMRADCGVTFLIRHMIEAQNIFTQPFAIYLNNHSPLIKLLFSFCHIQSDGNRYKIDHIHQSGKSTRNLLINGSFAIVFNSVNKVIADMIGDCVTCRK